LIQKKHHIPAKAVAGEFGVPLSAVAPWGTPGGQGEVWRVAGKHGVQAVKIFTAPAEPHRIPAEIEALSRVTHRNVVRYEGQSAVKVGNDTFQYIRYEFVDGCSLDTALNAGLPNSKDLAALGHGLLSGLKALHESSVVHRDLKPMNIMLRSSDWKQPVIIDFGLVRLVDKATRTVYPWAHGTWPWMAPEQLAGQRVFQRADIFAAGIILYQSAVGGHPFVASQEMRAFPPPDYPKRFYQPIQFQGARKPLADVIAHCLHPLAVRRPSSAQALSAWERLP